MNNSQLSINIFLTEKFLGKCWHECDKLVFADPNYSTVYSCKNCKEVWETNADLFTPDGFFLLWEKAQGEEWWAAFRKYAYKKNIPHFHTFWEKEVNPLTFPTLLAEYLGWKEEI